MHQFNSNIACDPLRCVFQSGEAALHVAARYGHTEVMEYLCIDAKINIQDKVCIVNDSVTQQLTTGSGLNTYLFKATFS